MSRRRERKQAQPILREALAETTLGLAELLRTGRAYAKLDAQGKLIFFADKHKPDDPLPTEEAVRLLLTGEA